MNANIGWRIIWKDAYSHYFKNGKSLCGMWETSEKKYYAKPKSEACPECKKLSRKG